MSPTFRVSILIPVFNEGNNISLLLEKVYFQKIHQKNAHHLDLEIIVINDGSTDGGVTDRKIQEKVQENKVDRYICFEKNQGKGAAVIAGLKAATGEYVLFQDADLEYDPNDYSLLFSPILEDQALCQVSVDVVMGTRLLGSKATRVFYFWHKIGNHFLTLMFNILNNTTFTDIYTCYFLFKKNLINPEELKYTRWEQQAELLTLAVHRGSVFYDVPISYRGRRYEEGKKIRFYHAFSVVKAIIFVKIRLFIHTIVKTPKKRSLSCN